MNGDANKDLVIRFVDAFWSKGDMAAIGDLMALDATIHQPEVGGTAGLKAFNRTLRTAFPDWHSTPEELIAEGENVAERWTGRGTHLGEFQGIPPTGRRVEVPGVVFYRIMNGKIVDFRGSFDMLRMLQQLGALPQLASTPASPH
jgi:steroid delta-isomerase-like uncharacterized protein